MTTNNNIFELIEAISRAERFEQGHSVLRKALIELGLSHVAYAAINLPTTQRARPLIAVTYAPEWERHYLQQGYVNIDPVVRAGLAGVLPVDWSDLKIDDPFLIRFFGEAQEFKVGRTGLSIPVRGRHNEFALFSVTSEVTDHEWARMKPDIIRELMVVSYYFHDWALRKEGIDKNDYLNSLSSREKECLMWRSLGKSDWDISEILGISQSTVKFHLENARSKLGAMNTTHAVAKAMSLGLIQMP